MSRGTQPLTRRKMFFCRIDLGLGFISANCSESMRISLRSVVARSVELAREISCRHALQSRRCIGQGTLHAAAGTAAHRVSKIQSNADR